MSSQAWTRLIRFVDDSGRETFGEPCIQSYLELDEQLARNELYAIEYKGASPFSGLVRGEKMHVRALSNILKSSDVPIIRCIGLNYIKHSEFLFVSITCGHILTMSNLAVKEGGRTPPPYPSVFIKPSTSIAGFQEDIPIPDIAQDGTVDYEGELVSTHSLFLFLPLA